MGGLPFYFNHLSLKFTNLLPTKNNNYIYMQLCLAQQNMQIMIKKVCLLIAVGCKSDKNSFYEA